MTGRFTEASHRHEFSESPWAVVCDFDGTAIVGDIADALALRYLGHEEFGRVNAEYERGEMTFRDLLHKLFDPITATKNEIRDFVQSYVQFRPGFIRLLELARDQDVPFTLASGGLDIYIHPALELVDPSLTRCVTLRANHAHPVPAGLAVSFPYEHVPGGCGRCGSCKGAIVRELQASGYRVIAIGDGNADRCMAGVADVLFARARLRDWCERSQVNYIAFESLDVVVEFLEAHSPFRGEPIDEAQPSIA